MHELNFIDLVEAQDIAPVLIYLIVVYARVSIFSN